MPLIINYNPEQKHNVRMLEKAYELMKTTGNNIVIGTRTIAKITHIPDTDNHLNPITKVRTEYERRNYTVKPDWTMKLENDKLFIISDHICSTVDLTKEEIRLVTEEY